MVNSSKCGEFNKHGATFWCNSKSMGFAICASASASASAIATKWMGFGVRVYVIALGDMPLNFLLCRCIVRTVYGYFICLVMIGLLLLGMENAVRLRL